MYELLTPFASIVNTSNKTRNRRIRPSKLFQKFIVKSFVKVSTLFLRDLAAILLAVALRVLKSKNHNINKKSFI